MKKFIVSLKNNSHIEVLNTFDECIESISDINKRGFDGSSFSTFGAPCRTDFDGNVIEEPYYIDSVVLTRKEQGKGTYQFKEMYYTFFITAFCTETNKKLELN